MAKCGHSANDEVERRIEEAGTTSAPPLDLSGLHLIDLWHDRRIPPGKEWKPQIDEELDRADIILLLVSSDFVASNYCYDVEVTRAMARHYAGEARVIPVVLRDETGTPRPSPSAGRCQRKASRWPREGGAGMPGIRLGGASPKASRL
jgi:hypothetical protein